ncbi:MAG: biotin--[acetyl-CoA-carboxylase] ligase [Planctomycetota bacterium]
MRRAHFRETDSTNAEASRIASGWAPTGGVPEAVLVSADRQTAGRGRTGRAWQSPPGGAYFSLAYPWRGPEGDAARLPLVAGLAVRESVAGAFGVDAERLRVKWPNDLLLDGRKLAGLMCERVVGWVAEDGLVRETGWSAVVVGVGVNVAAPGPDPAGCRVPPITLGEVLEKEIVPSDVVEHCGGAILEEIAQFEADGWSASVSRRLGEALAWVGRAVTVGGADGGAPIEGVIDGVDEAGRLVLRDAQTGEARAVASGEVVEVRESPAG